MILLYFNVKCALGDRKFIHSFITDGCFRSKKNLARLGDSPTGCLATEREVEYFKRGCSFSRTRQLAGAMAFCNTKHTEVSCESTKKGEKDTFYKVKCSKQPCRELNASKISPIKWKRKSGPARGQQAKLKSTTS